MDTTQWVEGARADRPGRSLRIRLDLETRAIGGPVFDAILSRATRRRAARRHQPAIETVFYSPHTESNFEPANVPAPAARALALPFHKTTEKAPLGRAGFRRAR
jgi:hypothetical protein